MGTFWESWRREIIRGAVLFCTVLAVWLFARHLMARVRQGVESGLPAALNELRNTFDDGGGGDRRGPRMTAAPWTYRTKVAPQQWVWIRNTRGSITVEPATGDSVSVTAVKTYGSGNPASVQLVTAPYAGGIAICAVSAGGDARCGPDESGFDMHGPHRNDVGVEFTVRLPSRTRFGAATFLGDVHVTGAHAPLVLHTVSGDVDATTTRGPVSVRSVNGSVHVRITAFGDTGAVSIGSVNGSVTAELPAQLDADVEARTVNGSITTDYPLPVNGKFTAHDVKGQVGRGGRKVDITTVNGSIRLKKAL
jgi:hypothetical protein